MDPGDCWPWQGAINRKRGGYGAFYDDPEYGPQRLRRAHRVAWELANGRRLTQDETVMHDCDNPPCCNPGHLSVGTQSANLADMTTKGRRVGKARQGPDQYLAALTADQVRWIRHQTGVLTRREMADHLGVSIKVVGGVVRGETYRNVA